MCGLTGFFTGCEFSATCDRKPASCPHRLAPQLFAKWDEKASVRRAPRRVLDPEDRALDMFPRDLVPAISHPIVQKRYTERIPRLLALALFRYLTFTINLETIVVNPVTQDLILGRAPVRLRADEILTAYKVYTDEAYHALFCVDMLEQVVKATEYAQAPQEKPSFLKAFERIEGDGPTAFARRFLFTGVSEMLITLSLNNVRDSQREDTPAAIRQLMTDHSGDEVRHHAFYREALTDYLTGLDRERAVEAAALMPDYVMAFVAPDLDNVRLELRAVGLTEDEARQVCHETYDPDMVARYAAACTGGIADLLKGLDLGGYAQVSDGFERIGIRL